MSLSELIYYNVHNSSITVPYFWQGWLQAVMETFTILLDNEYFWLYKNRYKK